MKNKICEEHITLGYWYALGGCELKHLDYGIEDYAYIRSHVMTNTLQNHKCKVYITTTGRAYVVICGTRLYFEDCVTIADWA